MENKFIRADDVARELSVSTASIFTSDFMAKERRLNKCLYSKTRATTLGM